MWVLLIIFMTLNKETVLAHYDTVQDCQTERDLVGFNMAESYPYTHDFDIICRYEALRNPRSRA